ncbi:MAG: type II toxin-antitoxin system PemK/MazF family toxin [Dehalococcoidia bacterium]|nr:MAG: type II toxin-antitoxin system PemK/MazF family toxin [Dehalococcoidia bacterium]
MGRRPVVLVGRRTAYSRRDAVIGILVTTQVRGLPTEIPLGSGEGLPHPCVANADTLLTFDRALLLNRAGSLGDEKLAALDNALRYALDL